MPGASIAVAGLRHRYRASAGAVAVLAGLDLQVDGGGYVAITGASGTGKSTLLSVLGGLEAPQEGEVVVGGHDLHELSGDGLADFRRRTVGFVFQHFGLLDTLTAVENVALACSLNGVSSRAGTKRAAALLDALDMSHRLHHTPTTLSGGERQRVAIARALANEPSLVLADEPTGNLDDESTVRIVELLEALPDEHDCTLLIVTHDRRLADRAHRQYDLRGGRLHEAGVRASGERPPDDVDALDEIEELGA